MSFARLHDAIRQVPSGAWAVGVSGGADSVAMLRLLRERADLDLHVVHLDHETRGGESTADADFVRELCLSWKLPCRLARRSEIEPTLADRLPKNVSAKYRAIRIALFREVVESNRLQGVILAHHADDQAETILHRLLRGASGSALIGMRPRSDVAGLNICRPLLDIPRGLLRDYLSGIGQTWREDASNASDDYERNRLRKWLSSHPGVIDALLNLARAMHRLSAWQSIAAPVLADDFPRADLATLPEVLAEPAAREWLKRQGVPPDEISGTTIDRLIQQAVDSAQPSRQHFPGGVVVQRHKNLIRANPER